MVEGVDVTWPLKAELSKVLWIGSPLPDERLPVALGPGRFLRLIEELLRQGIRQLLARQMPNVGISARLADEFEDVVSHEFAGKRLCGEGNSKSVRASWHRPGDQTNSASVDRSVR